MTQPRTEFQHMETMLEIIEKTDGLKAETQPAAAGVPLDDARQEIEFKLKIGQSPVWASILQLDDFLVKAIA